MIISAQTPSFAFQMGLLETTMQLLLSLDSYLL